MTDRMLEIDGFYLPPEFSGEISGYDTETFQRGDVEVCLRTPRITRAVVGELCDYLRKNQEKYLRSMPLAHIIEVLDRASRRWMDKGYVYRKRALQSIPVMTGFSAETVAASIDVEMESSLSEDMWRALRSEIGNPLYLDDFQYDPELEGYRRAFGPDLMVSFFSENIPALPHLLFMRAALVKSACLGKVASGEPTFAPMYLKTVAEIDPDLARCMAVLYWRGGEVGVEDAAFEQADAVIFFGGIRSANSLIERIPRRIRVLIHGHKLGFGVIGKEMLTTDRADQLAAAAAYDLSMFDQQACLAPHVYYAEEGGQVSVPAFAEKVAQKTAICMPPCPGVRFHRPIRPPLPSCAGSMKCGNCGGTAWLFMPRPAEPTGRLCTKKTREYSGRRP